jgi:hypothetical protein
MLLIGIDPGVNTGVAVFKDGVLDNLITFTHWEAIDYIKDRSKNHGLVNMVIFEDSRKTRAIFQRGVSPLAMRKIARNVGMVDAYCKEIEELCKCLNIPFGSVSPRSKGAKLDSKLFKAVTGWAKRSNQHERDASMVAWPYRHVKEIT